MPPGTWLSVLLFLLLVAPGLLFELLNEQRRAGYAESTFREIGRTILASLLFSGLAVAILATSRLARPDWTLSPQQLLQRGNAYAVANYRLLATTILLEVILALALAWLGHVLHNRKGRNPRIKPISAWVKVFRHDCPTGLAPYVRVRLKNGAVYHGRVEAYSPDFQLEDREIVLSKPLKYKTGDNPLMPLPGEYERVILDAKEIQVISVEYISSTPTKPRCNRLLQWLCAVIDRFGKGRSV
jgi:hypothetical protein